MKIQAGHIPFFSVIIPTYNRAFIIEKTIASVLNQTFEDFELIIVNDASTDNTGEVISRIQDKRIKLITLYSNAERGAARNRGIKESGGKYICFLDSDDTFLPNHLQVFYDFLKQNQFPSGLLFTHKKVKTEAGDETPDDIHAVSFSDKNKFAYLMRYTFNPTRVCVSRDVFKVFLFDTRISGIEDLDLWLRIATRFPVYEIKEITCVYYYHRDSYSLGNEQRFSRELNYFRYVFLKPELRKLLPAKEKRFLISRCHYFLAIQYFEKNRKRKTLLHALNAFSLYPRGYNKNANRTIWVMILYSIPFIRKFAGKIKAMVKK